MLPRRDGGAASEPLRLSILSVSQEEKGSWGEGRGEGAGWVGRLFPHLERERP